ncbi:50S ribosomal protein L15 [Candidatus Woesearchaeota archaeon]|nr:50S ribosomal protein L15 [Candidatus Woesearchaeota archaeon]
MPAARRKKFTRYRGSHTHGGGAKKKRRGAGHKGGKGFAGSGKRAHHMKQWIFKYFGKDYFGRKGFYSISRKDINAVNINFIEENISKLIQEKLAHEKDGAMEIDLEKIGFNKLLSSGNPSRKYKIIAKYFSEKAKKKIESAGGEIISS